MANKTSPKLTSRKAIEAALKNLKADDIVSVVFKPAHDKAWLFTEDGLTNFGDAHGDALWSCVVASVVCSDVREFRVASSAGDTVPDTDAKESARFTTRVGLKEQDSVRCPHPHMHPWWAGQDVTIVVSPNSSRPSSSTRAPSASTSTDSRMSSS